MVESTQNGSFSQSIFIRPHTPESGKESPSNNCCKQICLGFTLLILLLAGIQGFFVPGLIRRKIWDGIEHGTIHTEVDWGKSSFCSWQNNTGEDDIKIYFDLYLYNVTNPAEVLNGSVPKLKMVGPFSYYRYNIKYKPIFSEDKNKVSYIEWTHYRWSQATSGQGLYPNTNITIMNPTFFGLLSMPPYLPDFLRPTAWQTLQNAAFLEDIFLTGKAEELIFGIEVPILQRLAPILQNIAPDLGTTFKMFSNTSDPDEYAKTWHRNTIYTGHDDRKKVGMQHAFNDSTMIDYYRDPFPVEPSYAEYYGVDRIKKDEDLLLWVEDVYRTAEFSYNDSIKLHDVEVYRYHLKMHPQLDNTSVVPENAKFYQFGPHGMVNMSTCPPGSKKLPLPLFIGKPHMKDSGWEWTNKFLELEEASEFDETFVDIEPNTGATFRAKKFLQFNFPYNTSWEWYTNMGNPNLTSRFNILHNTTYMHPFGAASEHFEVSEDDCNTFVKEIYGGRFWATVAFVVGIVSICLLCMILICIAYCVFVQKETPRGSINDPTFSGRSSTARWKTYGHTGDFTSGHPTQDYTMLPDENIVGTKQAAGT